MRAAECLLLIPDGPSVGPAPLLSRIPWLPARLQYFVQCIRPLLEDGSEFAVRIQNCFNDFFWVVPRLPALRTTIARPKGVMHVVSASKRHPI
jgi:hypothetical protein